MLAILLEACPLKFTQGPRAFLTPESPNKWLQFSPLTQSCLQQIGDRNVSWLYAFCPFHRSNKLLSDKMTRLDHCDPYKQTYSRSADSIPQNMLATYVTLSCSPSPSAMEHAMRVLAHNNHKE